MASRLWPEGQGLWDALPLRCDQVERGLGAEALDQATPPEPHGITSSGTDPAVLPSSRQRAACTARVVSSSGVRAMPAPPVQQPDPEEGRGLRVVGVALEDPSAGGGVSSAGLCSGARVHTRVAHLPGLPSASWLWVCAGPGVCMPSGDTWWHLRSQCQPSGARGCREPSRCEGEGRLALDWPGLAQRDQRLQGFCPGLTHFPGPAP